MNKNWFNKALAHDILKQGHRAIASFKKVIELGSKQHEQGIRYAQSRVRELERDLLE